MSATYLKLFVDCLEKYQKLNDTEFGRLVRAALRYKATGADPAGLKREALLWDGMRLDIDRDNESYDAIVSTRSEAGKKGAKARWQTDGKNSKNGKSHLPYGTNGQDEDKDKEKEEDKDIKKESVKEKSAVRFVPPTVEEVRAYCNERGSGVDAERFVDFYASKGWVVGKTKMKDWKAAVRGWEREDKPVKTKTSAPSAEQKVTREDLERMRRFAEQMNGGEEHVKQD